MQEVVFQVSIKALSPLNISSGTQTKSEKTAFTVRDAQNKSMIPGTTLKGVLKQSYALISNEEHLSSGNCECKVCKLFGKGGYSPARIYIDDFKLKSPEYQEIRSANAIDRHRKVCVEGALFTKEVVYGEYEGFVTAYVEDEKQIKELKAALCLIKSIGGSKSRGLGNVEVAVKEVEA